MTVSKPHGLFGGVLSSTRSYRHISSHWGRKQRFGGRTPGRWSVNEQRRPAVCAWQEKKESFTGVGMFAGQEYRGVWGRVGGWVWTVGEVQGPYTLKS